MVRPMLEAHDKRYIDSQSASRTVFIKNINVGSTDFTLSREEKMHLIHLGKESTLEFLRK
jgi:NTE family protein